MFDARFSASLSCDRQSFIPSSSYWTVVWWFELLRVTGTSFGSACKRVCLCRLELWPFVWANEFVLLVSASWCACAWNYKKILPLYCSWFTLIGSEEIVFWERAGLNVSSCFPRSFCMIWGELTLADVFFVNFIVCLKVTFVPGTRWLAHQPLQTLVLAVRTESDYCGMLLHN
jgi:hypothetical protein